MLLGKLMMGRPNILLMDEPTNHMIGTIESLNTALENYKALCSLYLMMGVCRFIGDRIGN